jgi:hypothetical protein
VSEAIYCGLAAVQLRSLRGWLERLHSSFAGQLADFQLSRGTGYLVAGKLCFLDRREDVRVRNLLAKPSPTIQIAIHAALADDVLSHGQSPKGGGVSSRSRIIPASQPGSTGMTAAALSARIRRLGRLSLGVARET